MTRNEYTAAALAVMTYSHIMGTGKTPMFNPGSTDLSVRSVDTEGFRRTLNALRGIDMDKVSLNVVDCPMRKEHCNANCQP